MSPQFWREELSSWKHAKRITKTRIPWNSTPPKRWKIRLPRPQFQNKLCQITRARGERGEACCSRYSTYSTKIPWEKTQEKSTSKKSCWAQSKSQVNKLQRLKWLKAESKQICSASAFQRLWPVQVWGGSTIKVLSRNWTELHDGQQQAPFLGISELSVKGPDLKDFPSQFRLLHSLSQGICKGLARALTSAQAQLHVHSGYRTSAICQVEFTSNCKIPNASEFPVYLHARTGALSAMPCLLRHAVLGKQGGALTAQRLLVCPFGLLFFFGAPLVVHQLHSVASELAPSHKIYTTKKPGKHRETSVSLRDIRTTNGVRSFAEGHVQWLSVLGQMLSLLSFMFSKVCMSLPSRPSLTFQLYKMCKDYPIHI